MGDKVTQKIVLSILRFLRGELEAGTLNEDSTESLEVAVQCLESAYNVDRAAAQARNVPDLVEIFSSSDIWVEELPGVATEVVSEEVKAEAEKLKNVGNNLMKEEKFPEAIEAYSSAIALDTSNAVYFCNRAAAHSKLNNHPAAIQDCKNAIHLDPTYSKAYGRLGIAYSSLNHHVEARCSYLRALQLEPENESYKNNLQLTNEQIGRERSGPPPQQAPAIPGIPAGIDINMLINNPTLMTMASQMLSNPNMQNIMSGLMTMSQGDANVDALLQAGQQLAQQMQSANPEFVDNLRRQMGGPQDPQDPNDQTDSNPAEPRDNPPEH